MDTNILLESGTNELEILEFTLGEQSYGMNVAKIREILSYQPITPMPNSHPSIEGVFMPRDTMLTVIDLKHAIGVPENDKQGLFIISNFNNLNIAFHVDDVVGIKRVSWSEIIKPDNTVNKAGTGVSTGVVKFGNKLVVILDFEKIVTDISTASGLKVEEIEHFKGRDRKEYPILLAEDSPMLGKLLRNCLADAGYTNQIFTENGEEAWEKVLEFKKAGTIHEKIHLVITDIEMPKMDGHRLTKLIKTDEECKYIPVVIFSSLVNEEMRKKGEQLGADAQLTKPEIGMLVEAIDALLEKRNEAINKK
ncbi:MAG: chemotaxis protein [Lachnospiraceae bacterium]